MRAIDLVKPTLDGVTRLAALISLLMLAAMVGTYLFEVLARYAFNQPRQWPSNVAPGMFCASIFLALPEVARRGEHIAIDLIPHALPPRGRRIAGRVLMLVSAIVCVVVGYVCAVEVSKQIAQGITTFGSLPYPKWWVSILLPIGFGLTALQFLATALRAVD